MTAIEVVLWDLGGVILRTEDRRPRAAWESRLGLGEGELERLVFAGEMGRRAALGQAGPEQVWRWVGERLGLAEEDLQSLRREFWQGDRLDPALVQYIRDLRQDRRTALLSNAWPGMRRLIERDWGIGDCFEAVFISAELGLVKPDPAVYRLALDRLQVAPGQVLFVDDFPENVQAAAALGLHAVRFRSSDQTIQEVTAALADSGRSARLP